MTWSHHTICGDACRELIAPDWPSKPTCLVTDPPYRLSSGGCGVPRQASKGVPIQHTRMSGKFDAAVYDNGGDIVDQGPDWDAWLPLAYAALADDADAYVMANDKNLYDAQAAAFRAGFRLHNILVWIKDTITPNRWYMKNVEFCLYLWKGNARTINEPGSAQTIKCPTPRNAKHPTQKPVDLMRHWIANSTKPGDVVLDPFMGSGTTGVAAIRCDRRFIGIESNTEHFNTAQTRLNTERERAHRQPMLIA